MAQHICRMDSTVGWSGRRIQNTKDSSVRLRLSPRSGTKLAFRGCALLKVRDTGARRTLAPFLHQVCLRRFSRRFVVHFFATFTSREHVLMRPIPYLRVSFQVEYHTEAQKNSLPIVMSSKNLVCTWWQSSKLSPPEALKPFWGNKETGETIGMKALGLSWDEILLPTWYPFLSCNACGTRQYIENLMYLQYYHCNKSWTVLVYAPNK